MLIANTKKKHTGPNQELTKLIKFTNIFNSPFFFTFLNIYIMESSSSKQKQSRPRWACHHAKRLQTSPFLLCFSLNNREILEHFYIFSQEISLKSEQGQNAFQSSAFKIAEKRKHTVCVLMAVSGSVYTARHISCSFWGVEKEEWVDERGRCGSSVVMLCNGGCWVPKATWLLQFAAPTKLFPERLSPCNPSWRCHHLVEYLIPHRRVIY